MIVTVRPDRLEVERLEARKYKLLEEVRRCCEWIRHGESELDKGRWREGGEQDPQRVSGRRPSTAEDAHEPDEAQLPESKVREVLMYDPGQQSRRSGLGKRARCS